MGFFEKVASELGVGQPEIIDVFRKAINRAHDHPILTKEILDGIELGFRGMIEQLHSDNVINDDTKEKILKELKKHQSKPK